MPGRAGRAAPARRAGRAWRPGIATVASVLLVVTTAVAALAADRGATDPDAGTAPAASTMVASVPLPAGPDPLDLLAKGLLVGALLFLTLRVLRRLQAGPPAAGRRLTVLESRTLAPKASIHLVGIGERRLVVGLTPGGMVALADLDAEDLPEEVPAAPGVPGPEPAPALIAIRGLLRGVAR